VNKSSFDSGSRPIYDYILENNLALTLDIYDSALLSEIVYEVGLLEINFAIFAIEYSSLDCTISFENRCSVSHLSILKVENCTFSPDAVSESVVSSCNIFVDISVHTEAVNSHRQTWINIRFS
jgi:hypothetical protein